MDLNTECNAWGIMNSILLCFALKFNAGRTSLGFVALYCWVWSIICSYIIINHTHPPPKTTDFEI